MEDITDNLGKLVALIERISEWNLLTQIIMFVFSCLLIMHDKIPFVNGKLSDMKTIQSIAFIIFCLMSTILLLRLALFLYKRSPYHRRYVINNMFRELHSLTPDELSLLKYVYDKNCSAVYIPSKITACLTLLKKGYFQMLINGVCQRWPEKSKQSEPCYLCTLQPVLKKFLHQFYSSIKWVDFDMTELNKYQ